jgi:hypothetical protein
MVRPDYTAAAARVSRAGWPTPAVAVSLREIIGTVRRWMRLLVSLAAAAPSLAGGPAEGEEGARVVSREEILAAMRHSQGYALTATSNGPRLQVEVVLRLIRQAEATDPERRPLQIGHREWYEAFLERTELTPDQAPLYARLPYEIGQDMVVDYRWERVIEGVVRGPRPRAAANVRIFWPDAPGSPKQFSYDDRLSDPNLRVTQKRLIRYRLVDYGDRIWYAEVSGLHGRPTTGALGLFFKIIGEGRVLESRSAFSRDGLQIICGWARKLLITRGGIVTIWPDGHARQGVPRDRPDLEALARRLREPLEIRFRPYD